MSMENKQFYKSTSKYKNMNSIEFIEDYLGIKLLPYQKVILKAFNIKNKIYYTVFSPIRPYHVFSIQQLKEKTNEQ